MNRVKWILVLWIILAVSTFFQLLMVEYFGHYDYQLMDYLVTPLASLVTGVLLFFVMVLPLFDVIKNLPVVKQIFFLSILALAYSLAFILILHVFPHIFFPNPSDYRESVFGFIVADFHNVLKNFLFQIAILYVYEYISKETKLIKEQKDLEVELNQTKLQILKSQLQPHFLFNALNSVVAKIDENKMKAQEMLVNLGDILRVSLNSDFLNPVSLKEEIVFIEKYLSIEKIRYEEQLEYSINFSAHDLKMKVPGMILQPLIENSIKHGFKGINGQLKIILEGNAEEGIVIVKNNGSSLKREVFQIGLSNVAERIRIFTGNENAFQIYQEGNWVVNKIMLK